jgi:transposase-like protein
MSARTYHLLDPPSPRPRTPREPVVVVQTAAQLAPAAMQVADCARYCGVSPGTLDKWLRDGRLVSFVPRGGRSRLILVADALAFLTMMREEAIEADAARAEYAQLPDD